MRSYEKEGIWSIICGKWLYFGEEMAMRALIHARENRNRSWDVERAIYPCKRCKEWHLTKTLSSNPRYNAPDLREEPDGERQR